MISPSFSFYRNEYYNALVIRHMSHICCLLDVVFLMLNEGSYLQFEMTGVPSYMFMIWGDYRRGLDWWMDLLATCAHHSEVQLITALTLISTLYKSLAHPKFSQSSLVVS
jgi:hypothetical protein